MADKVFLDTDILIDFLRGKNDVVNWIISNKNTSLSTTTINVFELFYGAYLKGNKKEIDSLKDLLYSLEIVDLSSDSAEIAAKESVRLIKGGKEIEFRDCLIAATVLERNAFLKTNNLKHFKRFKGLKLIK